MTDSSVGLTGMAALVTGASSGIGAATARRLAAAGCRLVLVGRDADRLGEVARATGGLAVRADLAEPGAAAEVVQRAGEVDVLVNNAGAGWAGSLVDMPPADVERLVAVNLLAPLQLTRAIVPGLRARGRGHIVLVSSIAALGVRDEAVYSATKAGLRAFGDSLRYELAGSGVSVSVVLPGVVDTPFFDRRGRAYDRTRPRPVPPDRVAAAIVAAVTARRDEVYVPGWLGVPARVQGALPRTFRRLARRFG